MVWYVNYISNKAVLKKSSRRRDIFFYLDKTLSLEFYKLYIYTLSCTCNMSGMANNHYLLRISNETS